MNTFITFPPSLKTYVRSQRQVTHYNSLIHLVRYIIHSRYTIQVYYSIKFPNEIYKTSENYHIVQCNKVVANICLNDLLNLKLLRNIFLYLNHSIHFHFNDFFLGMHIKIWIHRQALKFAKISN